MFPISFGDPAATLYGVYHQPDPALARRRGVVICQPVFHEFAHSHRALRSLADQFAAAGLHALRFDYRGTGDSAGDGSECDLEQWTADIGTAIDELKASRDLAEVGLVGLRFGASLAARAAAQRGGVPFLVLWQPILEGGAYLHELRALQASWVAFEAEQRPGARRRATADEVIGYPLPPRLAAGMASLTLDAAQPAVAPAQRVLLIDEEGDDRYGALEKALARAGSRVMRRRVDADRIWSHAPDADQVRVPRSVLAGIVEWVGEEARP